MESGIRLGCIQATVAVDVDEDGDDSFCFWVGKP
jgi:hypothetical protein